MAAMSGALLFCDAQVFHARLRPAGLRFRYGVLSILLDLDRLEEAGRASPLFSIGRANVLGFDPRDHGRRDGSPLRDHVDALHREAGWPRPARVVLSCLPRILGFAFNPIAVYACFDEDGRATSAIYEVRNTFGQHHTYAVRLGDADGRRVAPHECGKVFYVSPFMEMGLRYRFLLTPPGDDGFALKIIERDAEGPVLTALMEAKPFAATVPALLARLAATPLLGAKVLTAIHWQALRLWLRGHRLHPRPSPPAPVSLWPQGLDDRPSPRGVPGGVA